MNNKMVGAVLKEEEEPNVTQHRPMWGDYLLLPGNCIATDLVHPHARPVALKTIGNWKWRWLTLGEASRYLWWTLHGGTTFLRKSNTFSHGWWNMNGGDTKLSEYAVYNWGWNISAWFSDFASFHPMSDSMTSSLLWRHRPALRALLVFWVKTVK